MYCFLKSRRISRLISYFLQGIVHNPLPLVVQKKSVHTLVTAETAAIHPWFLFKKATFFYDFLKINGQLNPRAFSFSSTTDASANGIGRVGGGGGHLMNRTDGRHWTMGVTGMGLHRNNGGTKNNVRNYLLGSFAF